MIIYSGEAAPLPAKRFTMIYKCSKGKCKHRNYYAYHKNIICQAYQPVFSAQHNGQVINIFYK